MIIVQSFSLGDTSRDRILRDKHHKNAELLFVRQVQVNAKMMRQVTHTSKVTKYSGGLKFYRLSGMMMVTFENNVVVNETLLFFVLECKPCK